MSEYRAMNHPETGSSKLYSGAARLLALTMAGWTALLVLFYPDSLAAKISGGNAAGNIVNGAILACCALGLADFVWHDIRGRLIWPSFPRYYRHRVCVMLYSSLAGLTGLRAFVATGNDDVGIVALGAYYLMCSVGMAILTVALALESRNDHA